MKQRFLTVLLAIGLGGCGAQNFSIEPAGSNFAQTVTMNKEVDVLWVVDTSGSMAAHQNNIAAQVSKFVDSLNATGLDYHIGVTSMDMSGSGARGRLVAQTGTPVVLTKSTPNLIGLLIGRLKLGEVGSATERGREATLEALTLTASGKANSGFLRKDALLNVIFLSNEDDKSDDLVDYVAELDAIKPPLPLGDRSWIAHFLGVMPNDPTCTSAPWGVKLPGYRYIELVDASGGAKESICDADYSRALTNVKARVLEISTEFPLDRKPIEASIKVYVNGIEIPKSEVNGWTYRASANAIRFHGTAIPAAGAGIHVAFDPEGLK